MSDIKFDCPHCTQRVGAPPELAGRTGNCPNCKKPVEIPAPEEKATAPAASPAQKKKLVVKKPAAKGGVSSTAKRRPAARATGKKKSAAAPVSEPESAPDDNVSKKSRTVAALLCWFLGIIGVHRFYVGKVGTGIVQILTFGGFTIWLWIDFIMILCGKFKDKQGQQLSKW